LEAIPSFADIEDGTKDLVFDFSSSFESITRSALVKILIPYFALKLQQSRTF
jgi:hypothetical protein